MNISQNFDSGSIEVVSANDPKNIQLRLAPDNGASTRQWFYFNLDSIAGQLHNIHIINAGQSDFAKGWKGYQAVVSYDQQNWFRVPTTYDGEQLVISVTPEQSSLYFAYFAPYSQARHNELLATTSAFSQCHHSVLGLTPDGNPIDLLVIGEPQPHKKKIWITARQHPGETMAQWFVEGLLTALLQDSQLNREILDGAVFYVLPNMNPDGSIRGNHRTNSRGVNLNRQWAEPDKADCPEVFYVRQAMLNRGVDMFFDIHGDEVMPYNFMMGGASSEVLTEQANRFKQDFADSNPDFQLEYDYNNWGGCCATSGCGKAKLTTATAWVENQFNCLSLLLEMPFIDNVNRPDSKVGWSAQRSFELGRSMLEPLNKTLKAAADGQIQDRQHNTPGLENQSVPGSHRTGQNSAVPDLP